MNDGHTRKDTQQQSPPGLYFSRRRKKYKWTGSERRKRKK